MKYVLLLFFLFIISAITYGQDEKDCTWVDNKMLQIPTAETYATAAIAGYVHKNFTLPEHKLRAIYKWITANIRYDKDSMYFTNWGGDPEVKMASVLRKRKGVCDNYAALFTNIVLKCGMQSVVISGYTKFGGSINRSGHSWCAVAINKQLLLCDPTWDAGFNATPSWFLMSSENFIESHMPFDPLWQLLPNPLTHVQFKQGRLPLIKESKQYNISDSVNAFLQLDTLQQLEAAALRMKKAGFENDQLKIWHDYNAMKIAIIYQEQDMQQYNKAVQSLNNARKLFNDYVQYRNNNFTPLRTQKELNRLFHSIEMYIDSSYKSIKNIGRFVENYQYNSEELVSNLNKLSLRVKEEKAYLSAIQQREKM